MALEIVAGFPQAKISPEQPAASVEDRERLARG